MLGVSHRAFIWFQRQKHLRVDMTTREQRVYCYGGSLFVWGLCFVVVLLVLGFGGDFHPPPPLFCLFVFRYMELQKV